MDFIGCVADVHLNPGDEFSLPIPEVYAFVFNGDILNVLPKGISDWRTYEGWQTVQSLRAAVRFVPEVYFVIGNHEGRLSWAKELLRDTNFIVVRELDFAGIHFEHGHRFPRWFLLHDFADDITEWMNSNWLLRRFWYWFSKKMGWMPGSIKSVKPEKYHSVIGFYWAYALHEAYKHGWKTLVIGHTHTRANLNTEFVHLVDCGTNNIIVLGTATKGIRVKEQQGVAHGMRSLGIV